MHSIKDLIARKLFHNEIAFNRQTIFEFVFIYSYILPFYIIVADVVCIDIDTQSNSKALEG